MSDNIMGETNSCYDDIIVTYLKNHYINEHDIIGYFEKSETFDLIIRDLKAAGFSYCVRDSDDRNTKKRISKDDSESPDDTDKAAIFFARKSIPYLGMPFTIEKNTVYECAFGNKYYKSKSGQGKMKSSVDGKSSYHSCRRNVMSKKMGCQAKMILKKISIYPTFQLDESSNWRKKKMFIENLRSSLSSNPNSVEKSYRYWLTISQQFCHNHPPGSGLRSPSPKNKPKKKLRRSRENHEEVGSAVQQNSSLHLQEVYLPTVVNNCVDVQEMADVSPGRSNFEVPIQYVVEAVPLEDIQVMFREKLQKLFSQSHTCLNGGLLASFLPTLDEISITLENDNIVNENQT